MTAVESPTGHDSVHGRPPAGHGRYTLDGDAEVESRIERDQRLIAAAVQAAVPAHVFRALVLMGGYGRGEGGYRRRDGLPEPYNDYDYFVVVAHADRAQRKHLVEALAHQARALESKVGVEVDFALLREERLPRAEYSLMNAEMLWGHQVIAGDPQVLRTMPAMPFGSLPLAEFTRLMLNRGALLLMNQQRLAQGGTLRPAERAILFKYLLKAVLACGDARLAGNRCYDPAYATKRRLLRALDWPGQASFMGLYDLAWEHKFHPDETRFANADAAQWQQRLIALWLETLAWLEQQRLGQPIGDWTAYCAPAPPKGQGGRDWGGLRNLALTVRDLGPLMPLRQPRWSLRYPRERLIGALPLLLAHPGMATTPALAAALALPLDTPWSAAAARLLRLWGRYA
ncbi:MAG: hypothetical protein EOM91_07920 [Sphingobacteriia bacterium]|nr:hypothetical protein [Sphingobacteriia bacterium]NCC39904.1 hypothetical protein [Gammaproteobacteria bacterium]